jgi:hypothetical protein
MQFACQAAVACDAAGGVGEGGVFVVVLAGGQAVVPPAAQDVTLLQLFGYTGLFLSITLLLRVVLEILHSPRP